MLSSTAESQLVLAMREMPKFHPLLFWDLVCFSLSAENTLLEAICEILMVHPTTALVFFPFRHEDDTAKSEQWAESRQGGLNILFLLGSVSREAAPLESRMKRSHQKLGQSQKLEWVERYLRWCSGVISLVSKRHYFNTKNMNDGYIFQNVFAKSNINLLLFVSPLFFFYLLPMNIFLCLSFLFLSGQCF